MSIYLQSLCNERSLGYWCIFEVSVLKAIRVCSENGGQPKTSPWAKGTRKKEINGSYGQWDNENWERTPEQRMGRGGQMEICIRSLYIDISKTEKQRLLLLLFLLSLELGKIFFLIYIDDALVNLQRWLPVRPIPLVFTPLGGPLPQWFCSESALASAADKKQQNDHVWFLSLIQKNGNWILFSWIVCVVKSQVPLCKNISGNREKHT